MRDYPHPCPCGQTVRTYAQGVRHRDHQLVFVEAESVIRSVGDSDDH